MRVIRKNLALAIASALFLGSKVNTTSDCEYLERAIKYFNDDLKKAFDVNKCCDFNGIRCDVDKNIIEIKFNNVNKTKDIDSFAERIAKIKHLNYLDLANDNIKGSIPKSICKIKSLKNLNLSKNKLSGAIPYDCKNLENLEQINLQGNDDLDGYVPYFPKIRGCAYKDTKLCDITDSRCKSAPKNCTVDDIKSTNKKNGNPDPDSDKVTYPETRDRDFNLYDNYGYSYGYSGYDNYNNYGGYDISNYYGYDNGGAGYGYGDWGYNNGYDNSYYNNGYYGTGYDESYYGSGYDTSFYDNGYYDNGYYGSGYNNDFFGTNTNNDYTGTHTSEHTAHSTNTSAGFHNAGVNIIAFVIALVLFYLSRN